MFTFIFLSLFLLFTAISLSFDSFLYPGASLKYLYVDSKVILSVFAAVSLVVKFFGNVLFDKRLSWFNRKLVFPLLVLSSLGFVVLENMLYTNFVFSSFHLYSENFLYLAGLSGFVVYLSMSIKKQSLLTKSAYFAGPITLIGLVYLNFLNQNLFLKLVNEDGFFESLQFVLYLTASVFAFSVAWKTRFSWRAISFWYLLLAMGIFFISMEEISWGQRIFGFRTPSSLSEVNYQGETTVHNIRPVQDLIHFVYIGVGLWGLLGNKLLKRTSLSKKIVSYLAPPMHLSFYFFMITIYFVMHKYAHNYYELATVRQVSIPRWQEVAEAFLAAGLLLFTWKNYLRIRTGFRSID